MRRDQFLTRRRDIELENTINRLYSDDLDDDSDDDLDDDLDDADSSNVDGAQTAISTNQTNRLATLNATAIATADLGPS